MNPQSPPQGGGYPAQQQQQQQQQQRPGMAPPAHSYQHPQHQQHPQMYPRQPSGGAPPAMMSPPACDPRTSPQPPMPLQSPGLPGQQPQQQQQQQQQQRYPQQQQYSQQQAQGQPYGGLGQGVPQRNGPSPAPYGGPGQPVPGPPGPGGMGPASRQPSYSAGPPNVNGLDASMAQMSMNMGPPSPLPGTPQQQGGDYMSGPSKGKRAARAYHNEDQGQGGAATQAPYGYDQQQQQQQQQQYQQQPQQYKGQQPQQQHPYAQAPPPTGPQGAQSFQQQHQHRPDYLQSEQPEGQVFQQAGIPQPPHNPGTKLPGLRNRIDPEQIPSVVTVHEQDQATYDNEAYLTCGRGTVPLSTTQYTAIDQGSCTPRFMRLTTYNIPATDELAQTSHLPVGLVIQPFATPVLDKGEDPVYTVDFSETAPPRCKRCRGYINPWCLFIEAGQKFVCNLCGSASEVPPEYFSHLDVNGRRLDLEQRPELLRGSIDFVVPKDYWVQDAPPLTSGSTLTTPRTPQPLHYIFAIDVSCDTTQRRSQQVGNNPQDRELHPHPMLKEVCRTLKEVIYGTEEDGSAVADQDDETAEQQDQTGGNGAALHRRKAALPAGAKVAIITFDKVVHFYNLKAGLDRAQMLVVGDLDDMFMPLSEGFCVDAAESRPLIENLLDSIPDLFATNTAIESAIGGPLKGSLLALKHIGGQLNIFTTRMPTFGPGALKPREEAKLQGTDKERQLFVPQDPFYRSLAEEAVEAGVGINLFLFPSQFIDVASLGVLPGLTGGDVFFHPRFDPVRDGLKLQSQIRRTLTRETAYCVTMRVRCSEGLRIADHFGNFYQRNVTDLEFGTMDADKAVAALVKHESKLDDKKDAYFQCAVLYTSSTGERRVRLHNIAVPVTQVMSNVFRYADMDTTITYCAKDAIAKTITKPLREVRDNLTDLCTKVLLAYRKHCASTTSPGQLILPESFKLFPVYALAFIKTKALKGGPVVSDVRTHYMRLIKSMGVSDTMDALYPKMMAIHNVAPEAMTPDEYGRVRLPRLMRCSYARMEPHGAYFIHNGEIAVLWLGSAVSPQILRDLYDVESLDELNPRMTRLPKLPTRLSEQLRTIISTYETRRNGRRLPLYIARQNLDGIEIEFSNLLIEDANNDNLSYVDYLCFVHKNIQQELSGEKQHSEMDAQTMWRTW